MSGYAEQIRNIIMEMPCNQIFVAHDLKKESFPQLSEAAFYKTIERMVKQNQLAHLAKGLYYRPVMDENDIVPISDEAIVDYYISDNCGAMIGEGLFIEKRIASGFEKRISLLSNKLSESKKRIGEIEVHRTDLELNEETISVIQTLELLQNYNKVPNINKKEFIAYMHDFVDEYSDEVTEYVLSKCKYKKSTIAFLARILDWYGLAHSMHDYLSPLSDYKIPTIDELRLEIPKDIQFHLKQYVEKIKEIYQDDLYQIILFGSYAKGNYGRDSDIDIMILLSMDEETTIKRQFDTSEISFDFQVEYNLDINPVIRSKDTFFKWKNVHPFYKNVNKEGVCLYDAA